MYVCICHAVTDRDLHDAATSGACTLEEVGQRTRAGTGCGTCHERIQAVLSGGAVSVGR